MKKLIIGMIIAVVIVGILTVISQMTLQEADETISRADALIERSEK